MSQKKENIQKPFEEGRLRRPEENNKGKREKGSDLLPVGSMKISAMDEDA